MLVARALPSTPQIVLARPVPIYEMASNKMGGSDQPIILPGWSLLGSRQTPHFRSREWSDYRTKIVAHRGDNLILNPFAGVDASYQEEKHLPIT